MTYTNAYSVTNSSLTISTHTNPQSVNTQENVSLSVAIINDGKSTVQIRSVDLVAPEWNSTSYYGNDFRTHLAPNKTTVVTLEVKPPIDAVSGRYFLEVLTSTVGKDYLSGSEVDISGFDTIPLSGNLPLFLFVILVSGLITYALASVLLRRKVDFSYLQVSILSIALGLINWLFIGAIASWLMHKPLYSFFPIQSIHYNAWGVVLLFIAGALIGGLVFGIVIGASRLMRWNKRRRHGKERTQSRAQNQTELLRKGYIQTDRVWVDFLRNSVTQAKQTLGKGYTLLVKVNLREPVDNQLQLTGLLSYFEPSRPYDIVLHPKHTFYLEKKCEDILEELTSDKSNPIFPEKLKEPSPLKFSLINDPGYRSTMVRNYLGKKKGEFEYIGNIEHKVDRIVFDIKAKLTSSIKKDPSLKTFLNDLQQIDFSKHLGYLLERVETDFFKRVSSEYHKPVIIFGDNILSLEILGYHTFYAISMRSSSRESTLPQIFPESYNFDEYTFTRYVTID